MSNDTPAAASSAPKTSAARAAIADVRALEAAGLIDRSHGDVRTTADRLTVTIEL